MKVPRKQDQTPLELKRILETTEMRVLRKQDQTPLELKRLLKTAEVKVLMKTAGRTLLGRVRSEDIRCICKVEEINTWVKQRKSKWNDHINRITKHRIVRIARDK
jgi:hypothetical protein